MANRGITTSVARSARCRSALICWAPVASGASPTNLADVRAPARVARLLASPTGVLVILPLLVIAAGVVVLLLGRRATSDATESMARRQLTAQAADVQHDLEFALDQASPLIERLRALADPALPFEEVAMRLHDLHVGRPGVTNLSLGFPDGMMPGSYIDEATGEVRVQESRVGPSGTTRRNFRIADGAVSLVEEKRTDYDVRTRPQYAVTAERGTRMWSAPRTYFTSHTTGIQCAEPVYARDLGLRAVVDVAFDVGALSAFVVRPPIEDSRTVVFARDGTVLAFPGAPVPEVARREDRVLRHEDYADPALEALFARLAIAPPLDQHRFFALAAPDGAYLASVAPLGGRRAGVAEPLEWYLATLVPDRVLLGPTRTLERQSLVASAGALAIALGVALMFAWNLVRMRRAIGAARAAARTAEARARELGSYRLVDRLGAGGMGEVWRAEHLMLARQAAIKLVRPEALRDPEAAPKAHERFRREAQTLASMRSRNTIDLYDYGVADDGTFFYVMELLDGIDLEQVVRGHGALPAARVIHLIVQACQSLAEAHDAGLLHRDIKPANLMTCRAADEVDVIKVLDFGIVQRIGEPDADPFDIVSLPSSDRLVTTPSGRLTREDSLIGTPGYIAPEAAFGAAIDARSDLYALACVAWWLLTGREVFARGDENELVISHAREPLPPLRPLVHGWLPDELERVIISCLAKQPNERPADARSLAEALRAIAIPEEHAWTLQRAQAWWREHRPTAERSAVAPAVRAESIERVLVPPGRSAAPTVKG
jgi:serine/threonine protein kinase